MNHHIGSTGTAFHEAVFFICPYIRKPWMDKLLLQVMEVEMKRSGLTLLAGIPGFFMVDLALM